MKYTIVPAIIAQSQKELDELIFRVDSYVDLIQIDVMDGKFVKNKSNFFDLKLPKGKYEAHLMVKEPAEWINKYGHQVGTIIVHYESAGDLEKMIKKIKDLKKKVGVALNPETSIAVLEPYLKKIDQVLIMTAQPGQYGAPYLPEMETKIAALREIYKGDIEVDGGMTPETIKKVKEAGANMFCSGSYVVKNDNPKKAIDSLKKGLKK